ncbi:MAG: ATP-grasp domain-containing protein [Roseburia sp.]|nr:ATP-grasp domain-containing protein [Roseburia sp.]
MNILILSCGTRNKLMQYFKAKVNGFDKIIGTDCSPYAPALYEADIHYIVPRMTSPDYIDVILDICQKEAVSVVLPLQEDELALLASKRDIFLAKGILPVVSSPETIELCRDKYAFYEHMQQNGIPVLTSCRNFSEFQKYYEEKKMDFPVFTKPLRGCGSIGIQKVNNMELLSVLCKYSEEELLIQQFAEGEEFGVDVYVDMISHRPVSVFTKKKLRMRAGETEKSISVKDEALFALIQKAVSSLSLAGPVDMDVFLVGGQYYLSEINPRFGGGYPHAYACGVNFPRLIAGNAAGKENADTLGHYDEGICMLKFTDLITVKP